MFHKAKSRIGKLIALAVLAASNLSWAAEVQASLAFSISPSSSSVQLQAFLSSPVTVNFDAAGPYSGLNTTPTTVLLGDFTRSILPIGLGSDTENFDLSIAQTEPSVDGGFYDGSLSATFNLIGADVSVQFSNTSLTLGGITYQLASDPAGTPWVAGQSYTIPGLAPLSLYAYITGDTNGVVPEPMTLAVWGVLGLCGSAVAWRAKKKNLTA